MKAFRRSLLLFCLLPLLWCSTMAVVNFRRMRSEPVPVRSPLIAMGDSHIGCSVDTTVLVGAQNTALAAEPYLLSWYKLKFLAKHDRIDTLVLGFGPHNISDKDHSKFVHAGWATDRLMMRAYPLVPIGEVLRSSFHLKTYMRTLFMQFCLIPRDSHIQYIGSFSGLRKEFHADHAGRALIDISSRRTEPYRPSPNLALPTWIRSCSSASGSTSRFSGRHPESRSRFLSRGVPEAYRIRFKDLADGYRAAGVHVIDRSALFPGDSLFANSDHLNAKGARRFTRLLRDEMRGVADTILVQ